MINIVDFYLEETVDSDGRKITEIWAENDDYFEFCHNYIQWLFPLEEPSNFNPDAPLLTKENIQIFKANPKLRNNLLTSFVRFLKFLGLEYSSVEIFEREDFNPLLFKFSNHNWFRITRVLKSLKLLGLEKEAHELFNYLKKIHDKGCVSENSFSYWKEAVYGLVEM